MIDTFVQIGYFRISHAENQNIPFLKTVHLVQLLNMISHVFTTLR